MGSSLYKEAYISQAEKGSLTDAAVVALIEIREVIEENTAVQRSILDHARGISDESCDLLATINGFCRQVESVTAGLESQRVVVADLLKLVARLGDQVEQLANRGDVETRAFLPDAG